MLQYTARITSQDTPRVGGRNLITRASLRKATTDDGYGWVFESDKDNSIWLSTQRDYPQAKAGDTVTLSLLIRCDKSEWGASEWVIRVADSQGTLKYFYPNKEVFGEFYKHTWTFELRDDGRLPSTQLYNHVWRKDENGRTKFNKRVEAKYTKLEFGTIATDWTPAPEDVAENISTVSTSLVSLASTLLDPEQGEIHKLTSQLDKHKEDTDKSFEDLATHPLTIDDNGYWQIWSVKDSKYLTTQYQSRGATGATGAKGADGHSPSPEDVLGTSRFRELLGGEVTSKVTPLSNEINKSSKYAVDLINETQHQLCDLQVLGMSDGGVVEVKRQVSCVSYDYLTPSLGTATNPPQPPQPKYTTQQIPLTLRSSHDALSRQVSNLQVQLTSCSQRLTATKQELAKLKADTTITPILNADTRKRSGSTTLYPQYGDWLLTSDSKEQYISFSGLSAEVGRSIYIQTRRKAYLYANNHTFYGLPGTSSSIAVNQWLSNNTTYRFVRADATTWLVTASSSPYPWT